MSDAYYRKMNDGSHSSSTYHKKDGTNVRGMLKGEILEELRNWREWDGGINFLPLEAVVEIECVSETGERYRSKPILARTLDWSREAGIKGFRLINLDGVAK